MTQNKKQVQEGNLKTGQERRREMEILYNKFGLGPYSMILIEDDGGDKLYSLGDYSFVFWNGFEYELLAEETDKFLADPQPYREAFFIRDDNLLTVAKGIAFATGYKRLRRIDDKLFGVSIVGDLEPLDIPIEVVERFETGYLYDLRQGLMLSELKELGETQQLQD